MNIKRTLLKFIPGSVRLPLTYYYYKFRKGLDFELSIIPNIIKNCGCAIDVGANIGIYSFVLAKRCQRVEAFEPLPSCAAIIRAYNSGNINVHNVALSNKRGTASLYIPFTDKKEITQCASMKSMEGDKKSITVLLRTLDEFNFKNVSFIKIDVEGHELEALEGAVDTIQREKPIIFIEIEQRHLVDRKMEDIFQFILNLGYKGGFYFQKRYQPLKTFSYEEHQKPFLNNTESDLYVNNFLFEPLHRVVKLT